jgi:hypothetical protein
MFWFDCNCKYNSKIWIQLNAGFYHGKLLITFDVSSFYKTGGASFYNEVFLADKYLLLEPFITFFEEESAKIKKEVEIIPEFRLDMLFSDFLIIDNAIKEVHAKLKNYYLDKNYKDNWRSYVRFLKSMKMFEEDIFPGI